jgi:hypothetical protein
MSVSIGLSWRLKFALAVSPIEINYQFNDRGCIDSAAYKNNEADFLSLDCIDRGSKSIRTVNWACMAAVSAEFLYIYS